ncbi:GntR family transcriptional regulator [Rhizobium sullae]|uniref:DNA-binding GntR family transcriptional regulator n=1 Tax=Rhizobium sullae TaxID=50338 RepID=A0A4R3Q9T3_RHISU|nr:GntR family transcriptional regulator [Rhizobium sullae]TCU18203.1 DNA-binding GntR family transcriptional regulator [Rhizobium sullae]
MATSVEIYETLRRDVISGRYEPMHFFDPRQLAAEYYTSVVPIREALLRLTERGLLRRERNRGFFVEKITGSSAIFYLEQLKSSYIYASQRCIAMNVNKGIYDASFEVDKISKKREYLKAHDFIINRIFSESERDFIRGIWDRIWICRNVYLNDENTIEYLCDGLRDFSELFVANRVEASAEIVRDLFDNIIKTFPGIFGEGESMKPFTWRRLR